MKKEQRVYNHEIWAGCTCGNVWDARAHSSTVCPECERDCSADYLEKLRAIRTQGKFVPTP